MADSATRWNFPRDLHQALEARHEHDAAPVLDDRVDLVQDHGLDRRQRVPSADGGQQQRQALGRGDQDLGGPAQHALALALLGVAAAGLHAYVRERCAPVEERFAELPERLGEVPPDVVVQRLERRDVEHARGAGLRGAGRERVQRPEERGEGLAAAGRRRDDEVLPGGDAGPAPLLHVRGCGKAVAEPVGDAGVKGIERGHFARGKHLVLPCAGRGRGPSRLTRAGRRV